MIEENVINLFLQLGFQVMIVLFAYWSGRYNERIKFYTWLSNELIKDKQINIRKKEQ